MLGAGIYGLIGQSRRSGRQCGVARLRRGARSRHCSPRSLMPRLRRAIRVRQVPPTSRERAYGSTLLSFIVGLGAGLFGPDLCRHAIASFRGKSCESCSCIWKASLLCVGSRARLSSRARRHRVPRHSRSDVGQRAVHPRRGVRSPYRHRRRILLLGERRLSGARRRRRATGERSTDPGHSGRRPHLLCLYRL